MQKVVFLFALACGAPAGTRVSDAGTDGGLGQTEQELVTQVHDTSFSGCQSMTGAMFEGTPYGGLTYGASTCTTGGDIYVPRSKSVNLKLVQGNCSAAQFSRLTAAVDSLLAEYATSASLGGSGWVFAKNTSSSETVSCFDVPTSPLGSNSIRNYARTTLAVDFSNPVTDADSFYAGVAVTGNVTHQVDVNAIDAKTTDATFRARILRQAVCFTLNHRLGVGQYAGQRLACSDSDISNNDRVTFSVGERCRTRGFVDTTPSQYHWTDSANCADN